MVLVIGPSGEVNREAARQTMVCVTVRTAKARRGIRLVAALTIIGLSAVISIVVRREYASGDPRTVTVMTRNIYLGGDINGPIQAALGRTGSYLRHLLVRKRRRRAVTVSGFISTADPGEVTR